MKLTSFFCMVLLTLAGSIVAHASGVYNFSFAGTGFTGSGSFTVNASNMLTSISGSVTDGGTFNITGLSTFDAADNILYPAPIYLDRLGMSFNTDSGGQFNIFNTSFYDGLSNPGTFQLLSSDSSRGQVGGMTTFSVSAVPLPAAAPLMLTGLGLLGLARHRKKAIEAA